MDTITAAEHEALEWAYGNDPPAFAKNGGRSFSVIVPEFCILSARAPGQEIPKSYLPRKAHFEAVRYQFDGEKPFTRWRCINPVADPQSWHHPPPGWTEERDRLKAHLHPERFRSLQKAIAMAGRAET